MKQGIALCLLGLLALMLQGALATLLGPSLCPDLGLLVVIALGLRWPNLASGIWLAAGLGYASDLLSGSLLGQHALLRGLAFLGARLGSRQLKLRGALPRTVFVGAVSVLYGVALVSLTDFFTGGIDLRWRWFGGLLVHSAVNALLAPWISSLVQRVWSSLGEDESGQRLRLEPRQWAS